MSFIGIYRNPKTSVVKVTKRDEAKDIKLVSGTLSSEKRKEYLKMKIYEQAILQAHGRDTTEAMHELIREYFV